MMYDRIKKSIYLFAIVMVLGFIFSALPALAQTVTQGYGADSVLQRGMIVGLKTDDLRKVEAINNNELSRVQGVVISANESAVLISGSDEKVYVASTGRYEVLVSDQNGPINSGDYIAVSPVSGIGVKAGSSDTIVVGRATDSFNPNDSAGVIGTATVKSSSGEERSINIGRVSADISIAQNPLLERGGNLPSVLQRAGSQIAGKNVSLAKMYLGLAIIIVTAIITGSLVYSSVRSSLISIGRNPLGRSAIIKGLFQVVIIALAIFLSGIFGVYLLLKL